MALEVEAFTEWRAVLGKQAGDFLPEIYGFDTKSMMFAITCRVEEMIKGPPEAPMAIILSPFGESKRVGDILESGIAPADTEFASDPMSPYALGCPGLATKSSISLLSTTPVPAAV